MTNVQGFSSQCSILPGQVYILKYSIRGSRKTKLYIDETNGSNIPLRQPKAKMA